MTIPDYQTIMLPLLQFLKDEKEHALREIIQDISNEFHLTEQEREELLPSGGQPTIDNRVGWARTYMKKAGLLEDPKRGYVKITKKGLDVVKQNIHKIDINFLAKFPEFIEFRTNKKDNKEITESNFEPPNEKTPHELLGIGYQKIRDDLSQELLKLTKTCNPKFFEKLVVDLLLKMGYGGSQNEAGKAIGQSGDEGIDGFIKEDKLGLDIIYIQAKRWEGSVGRPEIQKFAGALQSKKAKKGIFITTSSFSKEALEYVSQIDTKIVLIDGEQLTQLMIDNDIGVTKVDLYEIKKIDSDFFFEE